MESNEILEEDNRYFYSSWVAYIKPSIYFFITTAIVLLVIVSKYTSIGAGESIYINPMSLYICTAFLVISIICYTLKVFFLKTLCLYYNKSGVYVFSGIFPWTKGTVGVLWRDISDASYKTGFVAWLTKSYTVRIGHRQTKTTEILIPLIYKGNEAVIQINEIIKRKSQN